MCTPIPLNVNGKKVLTTDITYDDLIVLYKDYILKNGKVPRLSECTSKNNLPQSRIINKILKNNNITYNEFMLQFDKVSRVRTVNIEDYDKYVAKYIDICKSNGKTLLQNDLINNHYGLPSANWFVKYCPDCNVKSYNSFIKYCGLQATKHIWTKSEVEKILIQYELKIDRPITKKDITPKNVGFSVIVLSRLYGGFENAKSEIGLRKTICNQPLSFNYYKNILTNIVLDYRTKTKKNYITWRDIESGEYGGAKINHKTLVAAFNRENIDLVSYIRSLGCMMNPSAFSYTYTFPNGECINSNYEYDTTQFLRKIGLQYNVDYFRSVPYKSFSNEQSKIDCDYVLNIRNNYLYIEVAGMIDNRHNDWKIRTYSTKIENKYRDRMVLKERLFIDNDLNYLILFSNDVENRKFETIIFDKIKSIIGNSSRPLLGDFLFGNKAKGGKL